MKTLKDLVQFAIDNDYKDDDMNYLLAISKIEWNLPMSSTFKMTAYWMIMQKHFIDAIVRWQLKEEKGYVGSGYPDLLAESLITELAIAISNGEIDEFSNNLLKNV